MLTEKTFDTGELTLAYLENESTNPPLVLLHGLTGWRADWHNLLPLLEPNWHIYMPELRGHGNSARGNSYRLADYTRDIIAFLRHINQPVVLVGWSLGALVAMTVTAQVPELVSRLVLLEPPLYTGIVPWDELHAGWQDYFGWAYDVTSANLSYEQLMARVEATFPTDGNEAALRAMTDQYARVASGTIEAAMKDRLWEGLDFLQTLRGIRPPTLMLHGDWDVGGVLRDEDLALFKAVFPAASVVRIIDAGHVLPIENPKTVLRDLDEFLAGV
jgi:pimeloyl-ACP methyl ester carboxylesterase